MLDPVTAASTVASIETEVAGHPYAITAIVATLCAGFAALVKVLFVMFERRINEKFAAQDAHNAEQDGRLDGIDGELRGYATHVAVGEKEMGEIHAAVRRVEEALETHIVKEEGTTWVKLDNLVDAVNAMRLQNEADHGMFKTNQAVMATRIDTLETKMPNGELKKLAEAFTMLAMRQAPAPRKARVRK